MPTKTIITNKSWAAQILNQKEEKFIIVSQMIYNEFTKSCITCKKIVLTSSDMKMFVFDKSIDIELHFKMAMKTTSDFSNLICLFDTKTICSGYINSIVATNNNYTSFKKCAITNNLRHLKCEFILNNNDNTCNQCKKIRKNINTNNFKIKHAIIKKTIKNKPSYKNTKARETRLRYKFQIVLTELKSVKNKINALNEDTLFQSIDKIDGMSVTQKLLIKESIKLCKYSKKTARKYNSEWILICLLLHIKSPKNYRFLKDNNIMPLPCVSTIRKYLSKISLKCGLDEEFFKAFSLKMDKKSEYQRHGILIFDEMHVRESVSLNVKNIKLVGLQDFGNCSNLIQKGSNRFVNHALVFMFTALADNYQQTVAVFGANGPTTGICVAKLILSIIRKIEICGGKIHGIVCDGATTNRRMWREFGIDGSWNNTINKTAHPYDKNRHLYFLSDVPHLIKCIRNRLLQKDLQVDKNKLVLYK